MRLKIALLLLILAAADLAACGRKDVPAYPPDAVERPGTLPQRRENIRYY
jgi:predicted small lipoprotein YifL